jgi:hypothetical protein
MRTDGEVNETFGARFCGCNKAILVNFYGSIDYQLLLPSLCTSFLVYLDWLFEASPAAEGVFEIQGVKRSKLFLVELMDQVSTIKIFKFEMNSIKCL